MLLYTVTILLAIIVSISSILTIFIFFKKLSCKTYKYVFLWILWVIALLFLVFARIDNIPLCLSLIFKSFNLFFNGLAFIHLEGIFRCQEKSRIDIKIKYVFFGTIFIIFLFFVLYTKLLLPLIYFTISHSIYLFIISIVYNRKWFALMSVGFVIFFSITSVYLIVYQNTLKSSWSYIFPVLYTICAIIGTIKNGNRKNIVIECEKKGCYKK